MPIISTYSQLRAAATPLPWTQVTASHPARHEANRILAVHSTNVLPSVLEAAQDLLNAQLEDPIKVADAARKLRKAITDAETVNLT
jgi:hypothetical protein